MAGGDGPVDWMDEGGSRLSDWPRCKGLDRSAGLWCWWAGVRSTAPPGEYISVRGSLFPYRTYTLIICQSFGLMLNSRNRILLSPRFNRVDIKRALYRCVAANFLSFAVCFRDKLRVVTVTIQNMNKFIGLDVNVHAICQSTFTLCSQMAYA